MKKKILFLICTVILAIIFSATGMLIYAENEGEGSDEPVLEEADYTVVFVHEEKEYPMTEDGGTYRCQSESLSAETLYRIRIENKNGTEVASALLYKNFAGKIGVNYDGTAITMSVGDGDIFDSQFDFKTNSYYISVKGGVIKNNVPDKFKGCVLSSFYFPKTQKVTVEAIHSDDQGVTQWVNNIGEDYGKQTQITVELKGSETRVELEAKIDYLPIDKLFDLSTSVTLKKDYEITKPVKLTEEKSYTLNLNGFSIKGTTGVFEIDGAELTVEGKGKIESTDDVNGAINLKSGALTLNEPTVLGNSSAISASGGTLTVNGGSYDSNEENYGAIHFSQNSDTVAVISDGSFNQSLSSNAALGVQGGDITIKGGSFYGPEAIRTYGLKRNIKIHLGTFFSDNFESDTQNYLDEGSKFDGDSTQGYTVSFKEKKYNITINDGVLSNGYSIWEYEAGVSVTVRPKQNADGMTFECWEILDGDITVEDLCAKQITFIMPEGDVVIRACFKAEGVDTGAIGTGTLPPTTDTGIITDTNGEPVGTTALPVGAVTDKKNNAAAGSMAIIILIIILIALLIAAIAVSIILIVRNYRAERDAAERAELGKSVVDNLADRLSALDFGVAAGASAGAFAGAFEDDEEENDTPQEKRPEGIDFDREIDLGLTNTIAGLDTATEAETVTPKSDGETKLRRPKKPVQRPGRTPNTTKDE